MSQYPFKAVHLKVFLLFIAVLFSSCNSPGNKSDREGDFESYAEEFISVFNSKDAAALDKYVDPARGLFYVNNPGAYTVIQHFTSFSKILNSEDTYGAGYVKTMNLNCKSLRHGIKPYYDCDKDDGWDKTGCFYGKENKFSVHKIYKDMVDYDLVNQEDVKSDMSIAENSKITHYIYNTENSLGFYFGRNTSGKWYLIAIDNVEPCSA